MQLNIHHVVKVETETRQIAEPGEPNYPEGLRVTRIYVRTSDGCDLTIVNFGIESGVAPAITPL